MTESVCTIEECYGSAVDASDLTLRFERGGPIDTLTAAGMVGINNPLAMSIWRWVYGQDDGERHAVLAGLVKLMKREATRRHWNRPDQLVEVTMVVADWYRNKVCQTCRGTRYQAIPGTPALSDAPCPACHGTGEKSLDKMLIKFGPEWIKRGKELRGHMDTQVSQAAGGMMWKMKRDIDVAGL